MKVTLVIPDYLSGRSFLQPPLEALYVAAMLEDQGHDVTVIDNRIKSLPIDRLIVEVGSQHPDLVGVVTSPYDQAQTYCVDSRIYQVYAVVNKLKTIMRDVSVFLIGAHGSVEPSIILRDTLADVVVRGEPEVTVTRLVDAVCRDRSLTGVQNIAFRKGSKVILTEVNPASCHPVLDEGLMPAYDKVDMRSYFGEDEEDNVPIKKERWANVIASRGCPFDCIFCYHFFGRRVRYRNPDCVVDEIRRLRDDFGIRDIFFFDSTFTLNHKWTAKICEKLVKQKVDIGWGCETRCDMVDRSILKLMKRANCHSIWLGLETFSPEVLRQLNKGYTIDVARSAINKIRQTNIKPLAFIMLGGPGETVNTLNTTLAAVHRYKINYTRSIIICCPRFGSKLYRLAKKQYPFIGKSWSSLYEIAGMVKNKITPGILQEASSIMMSREFIYDKKPPRLSTHRGSQAEY